MKNPRWKLETRKKGIICILFLAIFATSSKYLPLNGQDLGSIQSQLNQITGQISSLQNDISTQQSEVGSLLSQKSSLQENLSHIQSLLSQATDKENQINILINSLESLKTAAQQDLAQKVQLKDLSLQSLYESTQENPFFLFMSSTDAKTFLYRLALNEANVGNEKDNIIVLNNQIASLQQSLDKESQEKSIQDQQVQQLKSQQSQLQYELSQVQKNYTNANNKVAQDQGQINFLQQQYGQLSAQENAILAAKYNSSGGSIQYTNTTPPNCDSSARPSGNLPTGQRNTFSIAVNGNSITTNGSGPVVIMPNSINDDNTVNGSVRQGCYTGNVEFRTDTNANFINQTSTENYIQGIGEMPQDWDIKALDAQAVAARTYAMYQKSTGRAASNEQSNHYDLNDTTQYQSYDGVQGGSKVQAELDTFAKTIQYNNNPIDAEYSANNGGWERSNQEMWGSGAGYYPYLPSQSDSYGGVQYDNFSDPDGACAAYAKGVAAGEFYRPANPATWSGSNGIGTDGVVSILGNNGFEEMAGIANELMSGVQAGSIQLSNPNKYISEFQQAVGNYNYANFSFSQNRSANSTMSPSQVFNTLITSNGNTDSLNSIDVYGTSGHMSLSESSLYLAYNLASPGSDYLTSPLWYFVNSGSNVTFYAFGFGHSIGMSQCGAEGRAAAGQDYNQILSFYYPSTQIAMDNAITATNPSICSHIDSTFSTGDGCIRVGIDGYSSNDNIVTEHDSYSIWVNGSHVYSGNSGDTIEVMQN